MPPTPEPPLSRRPQHGATLAGEDLQLRYGATPVVDRVTLEIEPGRVTALVGPNGSGKSTLLRGLARLHRPRGGRVTLSAPEADARDAALLGARAFAREVTLFSQSRPAPQGVTVREVIAFGRHPHRRGFGRLTPEDAAAIDRAATVTGVSDMAERSVSELSGGEMQRVWLAACLAQETGVVLLDEPTNHLDLRYQFETLDLVRELADEHGVAIGIVLHDLDHAARVADRVILLRAGTVYASGSPAEVLTGPHISDVYEIRVEVAPDPRTGLLRIDPIGRRSSGARPQTPPPTKEERQ
ncbi:ABC transporter ATP-binding protein [Leucobacter luti]|uniref:Iron complex transport system ATP-binding protein n=1 Tax=Leucobacter luti TaxID=340320 RepID=A0A4Q7TSB3_9MICO|nr:ABC transporter ATP-binding protein [Leucobacter luti]MBL3699871.1 ABC transporter ATP-binding protein [Leucobacter luti]RZT62810.1 iron complex transport system ATP-binding protein [Leucobacter luti]